MHHSEMQDQLVGQQARVTQPVRRVIRRSRLTTGVGAGEIVTRTICSVFCLGVVLGALSLLSAINMVEDSFQALGDKFENVNCFRGAAIYEISVCSSAIVFHILVTITRIFYLTLEKSFRIYAILNGIACVFFVIFLLIGGISDAGTSNGTFHRSVDCISDSNFNTSNVCNELERVSTTAAISAILCFISMILFGVLLLIMICSYCAAKPKLLNGTRPESQVNAPSPQPTNWSLHMHNASTGSLQYNVAPTAPNSSIFRQNMVSHDMYTSSPSPPSSLTGTSQLYGPLPSAPTPSVLQSNASQHAHVLSPSSSHSEDSLTSMLSPAAPRRSPEPSNVLTNAQPSLPTNASYYMYQLAPASSYESEWVTS